MSEKNLTLPKRSKVISLDAFVDDIVYFQFGETIIGIPPLDPESYLAYRKRTGRDLLADVQIVTKVINYTAAMEMATTRATLLEAVVLETERILDADAQVPDDQKLAPEDRQEFINRMAAAQAEMDSLRQQLDNLANIHMITEHVSEGDYPIYQVHNLGILNEPVSARGIDLAVNILAGGFEVTNPQEEDPNLYVLSESPIGIEKARKLPFISRLFKMTDSGLNQPISLFYEIVLATQLLEVPESNNPDEEDDSKNE